MQICSTGVCNSSNCNIKLIYFRFWSCNIDADSSEAFSVWICSYYGKDIQKWHQRELRCSAVNIRHTEREWRDKKLYKWGYKCAETFLFFYHTCVCWNRMPTFSNFVIRLIFLRLSSNDRNVGFLSKLKYSL